MVIKLRSNSGDVKGPSIGLAAPKVTWDYRRRYRCGGHQHKLSVPRRVWRASSYFGRLYDLAPALRGMDN